MLNTETVPEKNTTGGQCVELGTGIYWEGAQGKFLGMNEMVYIWIVVAVTRVYSFVKAHQNIYLWAFFLEGGLNYLLIIF